MPEDSAEPNELKAILVNLTQGKMLHGAHEDTILVALKAVMAFVHEIVDQLETSGESPSVSCASGCSFCCHSLIRVIPAEALLIASYIRSHFLDNDIHALKIRIQEYRIAVDGKNLKKRVLMRNRMPCIFLKKDTCSIYSVRPFICRSWNSLDQSVCQSAFISGNHNAEIETSRARNFIYRTAKEVFQEMDIRMALETGSYAIPGAILDCLGHGDSLKRWCTNQPVFTN